MTDSVVAFLRHRGRVLLVRTPAGHWDALTARPSGQESPETAAWRRVHDLVGVEATVARSGGTLRLDDRTVVPVLVDVDERPTADPGAFPEPQPSPGDGVDDGSDREDEWEWVHPPAILRRETAPDLWRAYERVAPTLRTVAADDEHGSTWLSVRALEVLRDRAGLLAVRGDGEDWTELADLADRLRSARPGMAAVRNRVDRAMDAADARTAEAVERAGVAAVEGAIEADHEAARRAADRVGEAVLTLSRSGTVLRALHAADPETVFVAESRPAREGVGVAETLARAGTRVVLHTDAASGSVLADRVDTVLVGADAVHDDGSVVNKTGTRTVAAVAAHEDVPVYAVAATAKVATGPVRTESGPGSDLYDGDAAVETHDPVFDVTPPTLLDGVVTERGVLSADGVAEVARELSAVVDWADDETPER